MENKKEQFITTDKGETLAYDPTEDEYIPVVDAKDEFKKLSEGSSVPEDTKQAFYRERQKIVEEAELPDEQKGKLLRDIRQYIDEGDKERSRRNSRDNSSPSIETESDDEEPPIPMPVPGGVGSGVFFKTGKLLFSNYSTLYCFITTKPSAGPSLNRWMYLTSTNRAPRCFEAFISYKDQDGPMFVTFDWSKVPGNPWEKPVPISNLIEYRYNYTVAGVSFPTIYLKNTTRWLGGTTWVNEVSLKNYVRREWSLAYDNTYSLPGGLPYLWWGPILETFYPFPTDINSHGFFDAFLLQDGYERYLTPQVTDFVQKPGFDPQILRHNDSFIVREAPPHN